MPTPEAPVLYDERDDIAVVSLNRPDHLNTLTEAMVQGVADAIDRVTASPDVRAIVLRGECRAGTAGYDLQEGGLNIEAGVPSPFGALRSEPRPGDWDPVVDQQIMGNNVRRFMKVWECPKPVIGQIHGWAIGGATDLVLCCDLLYMAEDAVIGYAPSRIFGTRRL